MRVLSAAIILFLGVVSASGSQEPRVETIAGSGAIGMRDGPAKSASFLLPNGIARANDGTIYVSDEAAQRIRTIKDGRVSTVAGSGALGILGMSVQGGNKDGPALSAQFNHPMGIALAPDGALYIADSKNHAVRKLDHGVVSTVSSNLKSPRDLAFDAAGNLWIADFGSGVRFWDGRALRTPKLPDSSPDVLAVSVSQDAADPKLVVVSKRYVVEYDVKAAADADTKPYTGTKWTLVIESLQDEGYGIPFRLVALGNHQAVYTDLVTNTVRYVRFGVAPFAGPVAKRVAGGSGYDFIQNAAFADGTDARFNSPLGIFVHGRTITVADAGNRRIRELPLPSFRTPEYGFEGAAPYDDAHYEIALVGASNVFFDSHDDTDSICGVIEQRLNASRSIPKPVRCHTHRIDGVGDKIWDYIETYLAPQHVDMYVVQVPGREIEVKDVDMARKFLETTKSRMLLLGYPNSWNVSDDDGLYQRETTADFTDLPDDRSAGRAANDKQVVAAAATVPGLAIYDLLADEIRYEKNQNPPLWLAGTHMNARGNVFVGEHVADALLRVLGNTRR